jgi:arylformamidase
MDKVFLHYTSAELDRQYDQRAWAANAEEVIRRYGEESDAVRRRLGAPLSCRYGPTPAETLDVYRTGAARAPVHVFVHGGAWRLLSKRESAFAAELFVHAGAHFVALDFALLPQVNLAEMVAQVRRALAWLFGNAPAFGGDPGRIFVSGHSSGSHLAGNLVVTDWAGAFGLPPDLIKGAVCASGIYDLRPVRLSARSRYVHLDDAMEQDLSPIRHLDRLHCPVFTAYGAFESDEFKRQSRAFADAIAASGRPMEAVEAASLNHFELAETLGRADGILGAAALRQMGLVAPR